MFTSKGTSVCEFTQTASFEQVLILHNTLTSKRKCLVTKINLKVIIFKKGLENQHFKTNPYSPSPFDSGHEHMPRLWARWGGLQATADQ